MRVLRRVLLSGVVLVVVAAILGPVAIRLREPDAGSMLPAGVAGRFVTVAGQRVHVVEQGQGSPLVLIHGFGGSTFDFEEHMLEPLSHTHRVIALDLYGFGWSQRADALPYGWTLWADQIAGTLDTLGVERVAIAGHSMGGAVAAVFAARYPQRVEKLVLGDALYPLDDAEIAAPFRVMAMPVVGPLALGLVPDPSAPGSSPALRAHAWPTYRIRGTRHAWLRYLQDPTRRADLAAAYPAVESPTLILHGDADTFVPYAAMQRTAPQLRAARIVTIPGGGHFPFRDTPELVVREIDAFLAPDAARLPVAP